MKKLLLFIGFSGAAYASGFNADISLGTLGAGADIGYTFNRYIGLTANFNTANLSTLSNSTFSGNVGVNYGGNMDSLMAANLNTAGLLVDYYPVGNSFMLNTGIYYMQNTINLNYNASLSAPSVGANLVAADNNAIQFAPLGLYVGAGYSTATDSGLSFTARIGAIITQATTTTYSGISGGIVGLASASNMGTISSGSVDFLPVLSVGIGYSF
jgi:hypothetical protein